MTSRPRKRCGKSRPWSIAQYFGPIWLRACRMKFVIHSSPSRLSLNCCPSALTTPIFARNSTRSSSRKSIAWTKLSPKSTTSRIRRNSCLKSIDVRAPVKKGLEIARARFGVNGKVEIETSLPQRSAARTWRRNRPGGGFRSPGGERGRSQCRSDQAANYCFPRNRSGKAGKPPAVVVTVRDNGRGIAPEIKGENFLAVLHDEAAREWAWVCQSSNEQCSIIMAGSKSIRHPRGPRSAWCCQRAAEIPSRKFSSCDLRLAI